MIPLDVGPPFVISLLFMLSYVKIGQLPTSDGLFQRPRLAYFRAEQLGLAFGLREAEFAAQ
jgi:hypothetical protein